MTYPARFKDYPLDITVPSTLYAARDRDLDKWANQRFTLGGRLCRLINLKTYRYFRALPEGPREFVKEELINAMFSEDDQVMGANITNVGRHLVNSVPYKPVIHIRRKDFKAMGWRFRDVRDVEYGTARQIGRWMGDHLLTHVRVDFPHPNVFTKDTLKDELDAIYEMSEKELYEMYIDIYEEDTKAELSDGTQIQKWTVIGD